MIFSVVIFLIVFGYFAVNYYSRQIVNVESSNFILLDEFLSLAEQTDDVTLKESCYGLAGLYCARIGDINGLQKLSKLASSKFVTESYGQLVQKMIFDNKVDDALKIALSIDDQDTRDFCLITIQRRYSIIENYDQAFEVAQKVVFHNFEAVKDALVFQFANGNKKNAINSLRTLNSYKNKIKILCVFAQLYNDINDADNVKSLIEEAESYLTFLDNEPDKIECQICLIEIKIKSGLISSQDVNSVWRDFIVKIANINLSEQQERDLIRLELLKNLVVSQAATGHFALAKNTVDEIIKRINLIDRSLDKDKNIDYFLSELIAHLSDYGLWECSLQSLNKINDATMFADIFKGSLDRLYFKNHAAALELLKQTQTQTENISSYFFDGEVIKIKIEMYAYIVHVDQMSISDIANFVGEISNFDMRIKILLQLFQIQINTNKREVALAIIELVAEQICNHTSENTTDNIKKKTLLTAFNSLLYLNDGEYAAKLIDCYSSALDDKNISENEIQFTRIMSKAKTLILEDKPNDAKKIIIEIADDLLPKVTTGEPDILIEYKNILITMYYLLMDAFLKTESISDYQILSCSIKSFGLELGQAAFLGEYFWSRLVQKYAKSSRFDDAIKTSSGVISPLYCRDALSCLVTELSKHGKYETAVRIINSIQLTPNDVKIEVRKSVLALACENLFPYQDIGFMLQKDIKFENKIEITKYILSLKAVQFTYFYEYNSSVK
ncbi:MAG: hypothetical protein LBB88_10955 [Planctomycetaceae bacterium]|jgi:hypothetical protein|nr:hypothetical protein [Planctomycetaceae bacterium]